MLAWWFSALASPLGFPFVVPPFRGGAFALVASAAHDDGFLCAESYLG